MTNVNMKLGRKLRGNYIDMCFVVIKVSLINNLSVLFWLNKEKRVAQ